MIPAFYPIIDTDLLHQRAFDPVEAAKVLTDAGVRILQFRHKASYTRAIFTTAERIAQICRDAKAAFIVNDRADIAILLDAGLHIGQDDLPPAQARQLIGAGRMLGFSTHNETQMAAALAEPADYLAFGPVFATSSKLNPDPVVGLELLRRIRTIANRPLVAIGGIKRERAAEVLSSGADSIAVIGDLYPDPLDHASLRRRAIEWLEATQPSA